MNYNLSHILNIFWKWYMGAEARWVSTHWIITTKIDNHQRRLYGCILGEGNEIWCQFQSTNMEGNKNLRQSNIMYKKFQLLYNFLKWNIAHYQVQKHEEHLVRRPPFLMSTNLIGNSIVLKKFQGTCIWLFPHYHLISQLRHQEVQPEYKKVHNTAAFMTYNGRNN